MYTNNYAYQIFIINSNATWLVIVTKLKPIINGDIKR